ncbi:MAG: beta strand repeat-containing protein [Planctomycetota bacterium]
MSRPRLTLAIVLLAATSASAQSTWTGATNTSWNVGTNWSTGLVPTSSDDVIIASTANQPALYSSNPACRDLTIDPGATLTLGSLFDLSVAGDVNLDGTLLVTSTGSTISVAGDWLNAGTFTHGTSTVLFTGTGTLGGGAATAFHNLTQSSGTRTVSTAPTVAGALVVNGGTLDASGAALDCNGAVTVNAAGTLALGALTHTVAGAWTSNAVGASVTGSGTIQFDGTGTTLTATNSLPNASVSAGSRTLASTAIAGNLIQTGGTILLQQGTTVTVGGNVDLQAGSFQANAAGGSPQLLDIEGDASMAATTGTISSDTTIRCAGDWSATSAFNPVGGTIRLDGAGAASVSGTPIFFNLEISDGTKTVTVPTSVKGNLNVLSGTLDADAALDVDFAVTISAGATFDTGSSTHKVGLSWTSSALGAMTTGTGTIEFDGVGTLNAGGNPLPSVLISAGTRGVSTSSVLGTLTMTGGTLSLSAGATLTVGGDAEFLGGTFSSNFPGGAPQILDIEGSVTMNAIAGAIAADTTIRCSGDWSGSGTFAPTGGLVELDGAGTTQLSAIAPGFNPQFADLILRNGTRSVSSNFALDSTNLTIEAGAALDVGDKTLALLATTLSVQGSLSVAAGGQLALAGGVTGTVSGAGALLSVIGTSSNVAQLAGHAGGGYALSITGGATLAARHFLIQEPGPAGLVITDTALIAATPNDLRLGTFRLPSSTAGSALLDIERPAPADFRYLSFEDSLSVGSFNVRTLAGAALSFTNSSGAFAGPSFEDDPGGTPGNIDWLSESTSIGGFTARSGPEEILLTWSSIDEVDLDDWILEISDEVTPVNYTPLVELPPTGGGSGYQHLDLTATPGVQRTYRLSERLTHGTIQVLGTAVATAYSADLPANVLTVGASGVYADISTALAAVPGPNHFLSIEAGTYASFTVDSSVPSGLRILADGSGPVVIDTSSGPVLIEDRLASSSVSLMGLEIGAISSTFPALVVEDCAGVVVLDSLTLQGGAGEEGLRVSNSPRTALQRCDLAGDPGLKLEAGSVAVIGRGSIDDLELEGDSFLRTCGVGGSPGSSVEPGSTLIDYTGVMPNLEVPAFVSLHEPFLLNFEGEPNHGLLFVLSLSMVWLDAPGNPKLELAGLANLDGGLLLVLGNFSPAGTFSLPALLPPDPILLGLPFVMQPIDKDPGTSVHRWGNVATVVGLP